MSDEWTPDMIRALRDAATPGPWRLSSATRFSHDPVPMMRDYQRTVRGPGDFDNDHDAPWVADVAAIVGNGLSEPGWDAHLITAAPTLATIAADALDEVERLRAALKGAE